MSETPIQTAFNDAIAAIRERDARIAELEAVIRDALPHMKNWAYRQAMEVTERMRLLTEGEGNE